MAKPLSLALILAERTLAFAYTPKAAATAMAGRSYFRGSLPKAAHGSAARLHRRALRQPDPDRALRPPAAILPLEETAICAMQ